MEFLELWRLFAGEKGEERRCHLKTEQSRLLEVRFDQSPTNL
jgi:hypothetical protein